MRLFLGLAIYRLALPLLFVAAFPGWLVKMLRRGGLGTALAERASIYSIPLDDEPCGAIHFHAVSVGETLLALKIIREWSLTQPTRHFVIATGTATGHAVATAAHIAHLRVTYAPLDFPSMVARYLRRFEPAQIVLIEGDVWPNLLLACKRRQIRVTLVNARISPRSQRRYRRVAAWIRPVFRMLDAVAIQESEDATIWEDLGVPPERIHRTGSIKFDPGSGRRPGRRAEFQQMLDAFAPSGPIVLAASTHPGEEALLATAIASALPHALPLIVPRHSERREEVSAALQRSGFNVVLRSRFAPPAAPRHTCLVVDSTGELADWTAHADLVIIGKSFRSTGGQNPCEAILAGKPLIFGPHMENFEPLATRLTTAGGAIQVTDPAELPAAIRRATDPETARNLTRQASLTLDRHAGATRRVIDLLSPEIKPTI
jgi:3-deoxy-D-manno-octulosonic-acid transferase